MYLELLLVMCLQADSMYSAPMKLLIPLQYATPQAPFMRQNMGPANIGPPVVMYPQQPVMVLMPKISTITEDNNIFKEPNEPNAEDELKSNTGFIDNGSEAVIIDAEPNSAENGVRNPVILSRDQGRLSIGNIISYIPFLPIEINVPDTISWIYDLISSIGNRNSFRPRQDHINNVKRLTNRGPMMPVLMMPLDRPALPMQF